MTLRNARFNDKNRFINSHTPSSDDTSLCINGVTAPGKQLSLRHTMLVLYCLYIPTASCFWGTGFTARLVSQRIELIYLWVFFSLTRNILGYYLKLYYVLVIRKCFRINCSLRILHVDAISYNLRCWWRR